MNGRERPRPGAVGRGRWHAVLPLTIIVGLLGLACTPAAPAPAPAPAGAPSASQASGQTSAPAAPSPAAPTRLRVGLTATATVLAGPLWFAHDAGYFREEGLDAEVIRVEPGATVLAAIHNGELDMMATSASSFVLVYLQGLDT